VRVVVAGGRNYRLTPDDESFLDTIDITELIHGGCSGADTDAGEYAQKRGIPTMVFRADWRRYGRAAGPMRNKQMAENADAVVLFPGGSGTASMKREAVKAGCTVYLGGVYDAGKHALLPELRVIQRTIG